MAGARRVLITLKYITPPLCASDSYYYVHMVFSDRLSPQNKVILISYNNAPWLYYT